MSRRKVRIVGQFSDPQVELQMNEVVKTSQGIIDDVEIAHDNILDIHDIMEGKESKTGATAKANQAKEDAMAYTDQEISNVEEYIDQEIQSSKNDLEDQIAALKPLGGATEERPESPRLYGNYFDTTLGIPIWWTGVEWVDATGQTV